MSEITIKLEDSGSKGRYLARVAGETGAGEMTYSRVNRELVIVDHTEVPDNLRGKGVGAALARNLVEEARTKGFKIIPLCPFFKSQLDRHADWKDVISGTTP